LGQIRKTRTAADPQLIWYLHDLMNDTAKCPQVFESYLAFFTTFSCCTLWALCQFAGGCIAAWVCTLLCKNI